MSEVNRISNLLRFLGDQLVDFWEKVVVQDTENSKDGFEKLATALSQLAAVGTGAAQAVKLEDRFKELSKADWANNIGSGLPGAQYVDKIRPMAKSLPFVGNVTTVAPVLKEGYDYVANDGSGEDVAKAAGSAVASTAGAAFGGALGMPFGPLGAMAGAFIGSYVASEVATKAMQG